MYRLALLQFRPRFGCVDDNLRRVVTALSEVEADLVVLPELPFTGYLFRDRRELASLAEDPLRSSTVDALVSLCRQRHFHLVTGFAEKTRHKLFNSALLIGPRGLEHTYRKLHLFNNEKRWFDPGNLPLETLRVRRAQVGIMVCWDWAFPEVARTLALAGAQILAHPSNLVLDLCQGAMRTRCLENAVFAATVNRFGEDRRPHGSVRFTGRSQITGTRGEVLYRAAAAREVVHVVELDPALSRDKKLTPANHLHRDRRPRYYAR